MNCPYNFNNPVQAANFVGRWGLINEMVDDIVSPNGSSHAIIGGKRCGKTTVLHVLREQLWRRLEHPVAGQYTVLPVFLDLMSVEGKAPYFVYRRLVNELRGATTLDRYSFHPEPIFPLDLDIDLIDRFCGDHTTASGLDEFIGILGHIVERARSKHGLLRFAFLMDEVEQVVDEDWATNLFSQMRSLTTHPARSARIRYVMAGSQRFLGAQRRAGSPLHNMLTRHLLEPLSEFAIGELVARGNPLAEDVTHAVVQLSGGNPYLAQFLLYFLWELGSSANVEDVDEIKFRLRTEYADILNGWYESLGPEACRVYNTLARSVDWMSISEVRAGVADADVSIDEALYALCYHNLVQRGRKPIRHRCGSQLFREWFIERHGNRAPIPTGDTSQPLEQAATFKIKILFLAANPTNTARLRLGDEIRAIDQVLQRARFRDKFDLEQAHAVRVTELQSLLMRHQPHIVHFSGHGSESGEILLEDNAGQAHSVTPQALGKTFAVLKDNIRCVVLNACFSQIQAEAIAQNIDCVVGMSTVVGDEAAIGFASAFYQALAFGRNIRTAFELGCNQIDLATLGEENTPQLLALRADPAQVVFA